MGLFDGLFGSKPQATTTSNSAPWKNAQPFLQNTMEMTDKWLKNPMSSQIYGGSTVTPFSSQTLAGMNSQQKFAQGAGQNMQNRMGGIINNGGFNSQQQQAMGAYQRFLDPKMLGKGNPYLQDALANANDQIGTGINTAMSGAGRYGSGAHQATLAKAIGENSTNALFGQYNQDVNNMMGAAGSLFNAGQQGIGNMSSAYTAGTLPGQTLGNIGAANEGLANAYQQEKLDKFNQTRDAPLDAILRANAVFTGSGQLGSNTTQKTYQPTNWSQIASQGLGYALGGLF